jgi:hypothetical protein
MTHDLSTRLPSQRRSTTERTASTALDEAADKVLQVSSMLTSVLARHPGAAVTDRLDAAVDELDTVLAALRTAMLAVHDLQQQAADDPAEGLPPAHRGGSNG